MRVLIESIEDDMALLRPVFQIAGKEVEYRVPVEYLPSGHNAGDQIEIAFLPDPNRREDLRRNIKDLLKELPIGRQER
jgi:hypothetical protein